jgi:hypothetical protein
VTNPPATPDKDDVTVAVAAVQAAADEGTRLGLTWQLRPGTVTNTSPLTVIYDGDSAGISMTSMVGDIGVGQRVYAIFVPPSGNFIVGFCNEPPVRPAVVAFIDSSSSSAAVSSEAVVLTLPSTTYETGKAYAIYSDCASYLGSTGNFFDSQFRKDNATGASIGNSRGITVTIGGVGVGAAYTWRKIFIVTGAPVTTSLCQTLVASTGTITQIAYRYLEVEEIGLASSYPTARVLS